jgi:hypothetical protein
MTTTIDRTPTYLKEGAIDDSNLHLFSPDMREAFLFLQQYEDKPINPVKHNEVVLTTFWWKWKPQLMEMKQQNSNLPFRDIIAAMLPQIPANWEADLVMDLIVKTKKTWQAD